jgi:hypothetical protein
MANWRRIMRVQGIRKVRFASRRALPAAGRSGQRRRERRPSVSRRIARSSVGSRGDPGDPDPEPEPEPELGAALRERAA